MLPLSGTIDTTALVDVCRIDGAVDHGLLGEMLGQFIAENARRLDASRDAAARGDRHQLRTLAHAIRGSAAMLGAGRLQDLAWGLEADAATDDLNDLTRVVAAMSAEFDVVQDALRQAHPEALNGRA